MTTNIEALIEVCRSKAVSISDADEVVSLLLNEAAQKIESLNSYLAWREQLLRDATRYFDFGDDDAVAYYKALDRQGLTYKYGENVNPAHKKEPSLSALDAAIEARTALVKHVEARILDALRSEALSGIVMYEWSIPGQFRVDGSIDVNEVSQYIVDLCCAQELLVACSTLVEWVEAHAEERGLSWDAVIKARTAIAKATAP